MKNTQYGCSKKFRTICIIITLIIVVFLVSMLLQFMKRKAKSEYTIIFSTDLALNGDFDDYFDLVTMVSLGLDDMYIILDNTKGVQYTEWSGIESIKNLEKVTGKKIIYSLGISKKDKISATVNPVTEILKRTNNKVILISVGSLRDFALAFTDNETLFRQKVEKIFVFAGSAEGSYAEYNVSLDEDSFLTIMNTDLPIYWIPCFQNKIWSKGTNASYFTVCHNELFENATTPLFKWFLYRYESEKGNFNEYLLKDHISNDFMTETRNIWCSNILPFIFCNDNTYLDRYNEEDALEEIPFRYVEKMIHFERGGKVEYGCGNNIMVFEITDPDNYEKFSKWVIKDREYELFSVNNC